METQVTEHKSYGGIKRSYFIRRTFATAAQITDTWHCLQTHFFFLGNVSRNLGAQFILAHSNVKRRAREFKNMSFLRQRLTMVMIDLFLTFLFSLICIFSCKLSTMYHPLLLSAQCAFLLPTTFFLLFPSLSRSFFIFESTSVPVFLGLPSSIDLTLFFLLMFVRIKAVFPIDSTDACRLVFCQMCSYTL